MNHQKLHRANLLQSLTPQAQHEARKNRAESDRQGWQGAYDKLAQAETKAQPRPCRECHVTFTPDEQNHCRGVLRSLFCDYTCANKWARAVQAGDFAT